VSSIKTSVTIAVLDSFSAPLKNMAKALTGVQAKFDKIKVGENVQRNIDKTAATVQKFGKTAAPALTSVGTATDGVRQRMEAFTRVAELQEATNGAKRYEKEARAAMKASGADVDAAGRHLDAFGKLEGFKKQLAEARKLERGVKVATYGETKSLKGMEGVNRQVAGSFASLSKQAVASLHVMDGKVDVSAAHVKAFEKLAELRHAEDGFRRVQRAASGMGGPLGDATKKASTLRDSLRGIADATIAIGGLKSFAQGVFGTAMKPIESFASFDKAMAKVSAKTGEKKGSEGYSALEQQAKDVGAKTQYAPEDIARIQYELAGSGFTTAQILKAAPKVASLATASDMDPAAAAGVLGTTLNQYQLDASKAGEVADLLAKADQTSMASIEGLGESLVYAGANLHQLNIDLPESITLLTALAQKGLKGSMGGTALSDTFDRLVAPTKRVRGALAELGFGMEDVKSLQHDLASGGGGATNALKKIGEAMNGLAPEVKGELAEHLFGKEGKRAGISVLESLTGERTSAPDRLIKDGKEKEAFGSLLQGQGPQQFFPVQGAMLNPIDAIEQNLRPVTSFNAVTGKKETKGGAEGSVDEQAKTMESSAAGQIEKMSGAVGALVTNIGSKFAPEIERTTKAVGELADTLSAWSDANPTAAKGSSAALVAGGGAVAGGIGLASVKGIGGMLASLFGKTPLPAGAELGAAASKVASASAAASEAVAAAGVAAPKAAAVATSLLGRVGGLAVRALGPVGAIFTVLDLEQRRGKFAEELRRAPGGELAATPPIDATEPEAGASPLVPVAPAMPTAPPLNPIAPAAAKSATNGSALEAATPLQAVSAVEEPKPLASPARFSMLPPPEERPTLVAPRAAAQVAAGTSAGDEADTTKPATEAAPPKRPLTAKLEDLQRQQLDTARESERAAERRHRELTQALRRRGGGTSPTRMTEGL
jgi:TP901 family phage tail tape measure protein